LACQRRADGQPTDAAAAADRRRRVAGAGNPPVRNKLALLRLPVAPLQLRRRAAGQAAAALVGAGRRQGRKGCLMLFALFYILAISILIMHFTGFLARHKLEWLVLVLAAAVFPAVIYLR